MPITIVIYGPLVIFMVTINYYNPAYINSLFALKPTYLFPQAIILIVGRRVLLNQPWFTSVKGNHEAMALDAFETGDGNMWLASGGDWFFDLNDSEQQAAIDLLLKFHHLPHIIEVTNDNTKYVITHADYPGNEYLFGKEIAESELLWPVDRVQKSLNGELQQINGADYFIFGHMVFDNIQTFANQIYIDTGSPKSGRLSFYKIK